MEGRRPSKIHASMGDTKNCSSHAGAAKDDFAQPRLSCVRDFARDDSGQAITEYILLLSFVMVGVVAIMHTLLPMLNTVTMTIGGELEKDLKTGRTPLDIWKN